MSGRYVRALFGEVKDMTNRKKIQIYCGESLAAVLAGYDGERSARLNAVADRYLKMVRDACPALTEAEWMAIIDVGNGIFLDMQGISLLWAAIEDAAEDKVGEKWGVDNILALAEKFRALPLAGKIAVGEIVEKMWDTPDRMDRAALEAAGARIAGE
jgi:hypothetical protein